MRGARTFLYSHKAAATAPLPGAPICAVMVVKIKSLAKLGVNGIGQRMALKHILVATAVCLGLAGCGIFSGSDDTNFQLGSVGPSIKEVLKPLPKDLVGDDDNKLYGFDELRPPPEADPL